MRQINQKNWIELKRDKSTKIETIRAHFVGPAYDPHWHDSYLFGMTEQGIQQFNCRSKKQTSMPGTSFVLEPEEIHDGHAPEQEGFTYRMLFLSPDVFHKRLRGLFPNVPDSFELNVNKTLSQDRLLSSSISCAFASVHYQEPKIIQDACLDQMFANMTEHISWRKKQHKDSKYYRTALLAQEILHANLATNIGLSELANMLEIDRFQLTRAFKSVFLISPHAYLIQLRLVRARALLAQGKAPSEVASDLCFADQSHMGRWFKRCYRFTPAQYQQRTYLL